jgi:hypothetical protein
MGSKAVNHVRRAKVLIEHARILGKDLESVCFESDRLKSESRKIRSIQNPPPVFIMLTNSARHFLIKDKNTGFFLRDCGGWTLRVEKAKFFKSEYAADFARNSLVSKGAKAEGLTVLSSREYW